MDTPVRAYEQHILEPWRKFLPPMIGIVETSAFTREAEAHLDEDELSELKAFIASNPQSGLIIPATGGVRKLRWSASGWDEGGAAAVA